MGCSMKFPQPMKCCLFCSSMSPWLDPGTHRQAASDLHHPPSIFIINMCLERRWFV